MMLGHRNAEGLREVLDRDSGLDRDGPGRRRRRRLARLRGAHRCVSRACRPWLLPAAALDDDAPLSPAGSPRGGSGDWVLCVRRPSKVSLEAFARRAGASRLVLLVDDGGLALGQIVGGHLLDRPPRPPRRAPRPPRCVISPAATSSATTASRTAPASRSAVTASSAGRPRRRSLEASSWWAGTPQ